MATVELELYEALKKVLGESESKTLLKSIDEKVDKKFEDYKDILVTKEDMEKLRTEISNVKAELIKWMFIFWVGQTGLIIALIKLL